MDHKSNIEDTNGAGFLTSKVSVSSSVSSSSSSSSSSSGSLFNIEVNDEKVMALLNSHFSYRFFVFLCFLFAASNGE